jgi:hypothetical protein
LCADFIPGVLNQFEYLKKNQQKDNNQRDFIIKIWTFLVVTKSCLLLRDDGRKQILDKFDRCRHIDV